MPVVRVPQQTGNDCLPCCVAMILDQSLEVVLSWFEKRDYREVPVMLEVLDTKGYNVEEFDTVGEAGAVRRTVCLVDKAGKLEEGHAVVMDEDHSVIDPRSTPTAKK
jgi:hypothetical protein